MPFYTPKFSVTELDKGTNILASEHVQYLEAGATLDGTKFAAGNHKAGKLVARKISTGKFEPAAGATAATHDNFGILEHAFYSDGATDLVAGSVIVRGSVYEAKLADAVTAEFKALVPMIRFVTHK